MIIECDTKDHSNWPMPTNTPGRIAYEEDCRRMPTYQDGKPRKAWDELGNVERWSWEKDPTPRDWVRFPRV